MHLQVAAMVKDGEVNSQVDPIQASSASSKLGISARNPAWCVGAADVRSFTVEARSLLLKSTAIAVSLKLQR